MARTLPVCLFAASVVLFASTFSQSKLISSAEGSSKPLTRIAKIQSNDAYAVMLINNVLNFYSNNGVGSLNPLSQDGESFGFPKGGGHTVIFDEELIWGGFVNNKFNVGGTGYGRLLQAGKIITPGGPVNPPVADNPSLQRNRVYRIRPDINPKVSFESIQVKLDSEEARYLKRFNAFSGATTRQLYDQYISDWNEWPASDGAPFKDVNSNGIYDPGTDIPGVVGADQTLWYVANDLDSTRMLYTYDSPRTLGIEVQKTIWGYKLPGALGNTLFTSTRLINKGSYAIDSMFITVRTDNDIGGTAGYQTDLVGCDTSRNLGYAYKRIDTDTSYGSRPPAVGSLLLQGPLVPGLPTDTARQSGRIRPGFKNLRMTSFVPYLKQSPYDGPGNATQYYNMMNGLTVQGGALIVDSASGRVTRYVFSGDPVTGLGWTDGKWRISDRALQLSTGPFHFAPGDTQEVVSATIVAQGTDRLASVAALRSAVDEVRPKYTGTNPLVGVIDRQPIAKSFSLAQNYPNPFNPSTTISYELPRAAIVSLRIFNTLGQLVVTLVDEHKASGFYQVQWNAVVPSGIYFYRLQAGVYVETKKMILLK
jgi:hypothetical protein